MTLHDFILKCKKRIHYRLAGRKSIETYFMRVVQSTLSYTTFDYYGILFKARLKKSSDYDMVNQVLVQQEYHTALSYFLHQGSSPKHIIDAGSNIGAFSIYAKHLFPDANICCIEPDKDNFKILQSNLKTFQEDGSVRLYQAGLMAESGLNLAVSDSFRDGSHCAKQVEVTNENSDVKSISVIEVLNDNNWHYLDFFKIDIEGAETFLIDSRTDLSFLSKTKVIAIEIHDETNSRSVICNLLKKEGFVLLEDNETTIAINTVLHENPIH